MAVDDHLAEIGVMVEQGKELAAVLVSEEHLLSIITALCDVQGYPSEWPGITITSLGSALYLERSSKPGYERL